MQVAAPSGHTLKMIEVAAESNLWLFEDAAIQGDTAIVVIVSKKDPAKSPLDRSDCPTIFGAVVFFFLALILLPCLHPAAAQDSPPEVRTPWIPARGQAPARAPGNISGTVVDRTGAVVVGARLRLTRPNQSPSLETTSGENGQFSFANVPAGPFQLAITSAGFAAQPSSGVLRAGETYIVPPIVLAVATALTEVRVGLSPIEVAQEQVKDEEKQRVLGFVPNFYVSYVSHAAPLNAKQKFALAWKTSVDPVSFALVGAIAGIQQAQDDFSGYGQGAQGYGKRYGASYANFVSGTFIGSAILPSVLKQDPRYFYKGSGSKALPDFVRGCGLGYLQRRQRALAAELLKYFRKSCRRSNLKSVLSGQRS